MHIQTVAAVVCKGIDSCKGAPTQLGHPMGWEFEQVYGEQKYCFYV
jgi:hypothetical protein